MGAKDYENKKEYIGREKTIYFILLFSGEKNLVDFKTLKCQNDKYQPLIIYEKKIENGNKFLNDYKVLKLNIKTAEEYEKEKNHFRVEFENKEEVYSISFDVNKNSFIFDLELKRKNKSIDKEEEVNINQKIITYYNKLEIFEEALIENKENNQIKLLYNDSIYLYEITKKYSLLISLFIYFYEKKNICSKLLNIFKTINAKGYTARDRDENLGQYLYIFKQIYTKADTIINNNDYDSINFYGVILSYLNYYDTGNDFGEKINKLYKEKKYILFEVLIIFYSNFIKSLNQNLQFYNHFMSYVMKNKGVNIFEKSLNNIKNIEKFLSIINMNKNEIIKTYKDIKPINAPTEFILMKENKVIDNIIDSITESIDYSKHNKRLIIFLSSQFWINLVKEYNKPELENINNCYKLRNLFKKYHVLINILSNDNNLKYIKKDINKLFEEDKLSILLCQIIIEYFNNNKNKISNLEIIGIWEKYHPFYNIKDKDDNNKYQSSRDTYIFDYINFEHIDNRFIKSFRQLNIELIFKNNILELIHKLISKIKNISTFGAIIELIDINRIQDKKEDYFNLLKKIYECIIQKEIVSLKGDKLDKAIKILSKFFAEIFLYEKNCNFLKQKLNELGEINILICNELIKEYTGKEFETMRRNISAIFSNKYDLDNIIKLIDYFSDDDKQKFLKEILEKCEFTKEEFYSNNENKKINILCDLNDLGKLNIFGMENITYDIKLESKLDDIRNDLEKGLINIKQLEEFLKSKNIIKKLGLVLYDYDPYKKYDKLKGIVEEAKKDLNKLKWIKDCILIFHKTRYRNEIKTIINIINDLETKAIFEFRRPMIKETLNNIFKLQNLCEEINVVKDFLFFKIIYDNTKGREEESHFKNALNKLQEIKKSFINSNDIEDIYRENEYILNKVKDILCNKEQFQSNKIIEQMVQYFELKDQCKEDLIIICKSKKYEMDIKSKKLFFANFSNVNLLFPKNIELSKMELGDLKRTLRQFQQNNIYDYESNNEYYKIFTSFYGKKEAFDFLMNKIDCDIEYLKDRIDPTDKRISLKIIDDTIICLNQFKIFVSLKDDELLRCIKELDNYIIDKFINYSKNYLSIISLDQHRYNDSLKIYKEVYNIIQKSVIIFKQNKEDFSCIYDDENKSKNIDELLNIKNKINMITKNNEKIKEEKDLLDIKYNKLLFFKNLASNIEEIYNQMNILRIKGCCIPILIKIEIEYPKINYYLKKKHKEFNDIKNYLFLVKNDFDQQLNQIYKNDKYLRFLYGQLLRTVIKHFDNFCETNDLIRYILNKIESDDKIEDGEIPDWSMLEDYVTEFSKYNKIIFDYISKYINSIFSNNNLELEGHYQKFLIKKNKSKGFYLKRTDNSLMEVSIVYLFLEKLEQLPIAQNILICSRETSFEEMRSFFTRALLCEYNTLFIVEITKSFSEGQLNKMYTYINILLSYKMTKNKKENQFHDILRIEDFLDSCIIFICDKTLEYNISCINEFCKYSNNINLGVENDIIINNNRNNLYDNILNKLFNKTLLENIKVISSDVCGLGKSYRIKTMINEENKTYYHFPLGGILTKKIIYEKLLNIFETITKCKKKKDRIINIKDFYCNIAIHLDLTDISPKQLYSISVLNEFLLSFLITKFYSYDGDIIYIPNNIKIYIEIPNSSNNILSKIGILNIFKRESIVLGELILNKTKNATNIKISKLELEPKMRHFFKRFIGYKKNEKIEEFIKQYIDINNYSYHQIQIFIKLFITQCIRLEEQLSLNNNINEGIINICIDLFAKSSRYFTNGGLTNLLVQQNYKNNNTGEVDLYKNVDKNNLKDENFKIPLITINDETKKYELNFILFRTSKQKEENKKDDTKIKANNSYEYLIKLKQVLNLSNDIEQDKGNNKSLLSITNMDKDNYVITEDNCKKMVLLYYRIQANVPIIMIGETGCGKTSIIIKLNEILFNGEKLIKIIHIHPDISENDLYKIMKELNTKLKEKSINEISKNKNGYWVIFDQISTCLSFSLLTEIFINRTIRGENLDDNIRLIAICNPLRYKQAKTENFYVTKEDKEEDDDLRIYKVNQLPQSLLCYAYNFNIKDEDEKKYIHKIIDKLYDENEVKEKKLHKLTTETLYKCQKVIRNSFNDNSIVSLREINRFVKIYEFFMDYYKNKANKDIINDKNKNIFKINSIICSIYICYYIRLKSDEKRENFDRKLFNILVELVNIYSESYDDNNENIKNNYIHLCDKIKYTPLKDYIRDKDIKCFSDFLKIEEDFLLQQIYLDKGIGQNDLLKENLFVLFVSVITKIPLIIVGKSGTAKSLSVKLIYNSMKGKYSKNEFFKHYPKIIPIYYQCSRLTTSYDIEIIFNKVENLYKNYKINNNYEVMSIYMILFENIDLIGKSSLNLINALYSKLDLLDKNKGISFVGISNYIIYPGKINTVLCLSVVNNENRLDKLKETTKGIVKSISEELIKKDNFVIFNALSRAYYLYIKYLAFIQKLVVLKQYFNNNIKDEEKENFKYKNFKEIENNEVFKELLKNERTIKLEFHGNRDFYNLIKGVAIEGSKLCHFSKGYEITDIIETYIERNFGGVNYEIDIDFNLEKEDISEEIKLIKNILRNKIPNWCRRDEFEEKKIKVSSEYIFKNIYNLACSIEIKDNLLWRQYQIKEDNIEKNNIINCINGNINDYNRRHLLLEINSNLIPLILQNIKNNNPEIKDVEYINGSTFLGDNNNKEYIIQKINEIKDNASKPDKLIILHNLNQIHAYLYDLYNMNYTIIDEQKYVRIFLDNSTEELIPVNDTFRIIIFVDKNEISLLDYSFLNRFEKIRLNLSDYMVYGQKLIVREILNDIHLNYFIEKTEINYDLNKLLINCDEEEISGLVCNSFLGNKQELDKDEIKDKIYSKITKILPQDIILILPDNNLIKQKYNSEKKYNNFKEYLKDLESSRITHINNYKISIIYTFSAITENIIGQNNTEIELIISDIMTEAQLINDINNIKNINSNNTESNMILIHFDQNNSNKIQFLSDYIMNYYKEDKYNYIFIIHIQRTFDNKEKSDKIYSIPNIYKNINQLFIDNLNGLDISLSYLTKNLKDSLHRSKLLDKEFNKSLLYFVHNEINEKLQGINLNCLDEINNLSEEYYSNQIKRYMKNDNEFKNEIIKKVIDSINIDSKGLIEKMFKENYINKNTIDIISCILNYYKEKEFSKNLLCVFKVLEVNIFLTTLIGSKKDNKNDKKIIKELRSELLKSIKFIDKK